MKNTWYPTTMIAFWRPNISLGFQTPCCLENLDPQNIYLYLPILLSEVFGRHRVFINYEKQNSPSNHPLTTIPPPTSRLEMAGSVLLAPRHRRRTANWSWENSSRRKVSWRSKKGWTDISGAIPSRELTYPTEREVRKIIDSKCHFWIPSTSWRGPWGYQVRPFWWVCNGFSKV